MKINTISTNNFGSVITIPNYYAQVPAIVQSVEKAQLKSANRVIPKLKQSSNVPAKSENDMFILHEAVVPDTKIRVAGLPPKSGKHDYPTTKLKGPGRKFATNDWVRR